MADNPATITSILTLSSTVVARTGLRIGAQEASLTIGGVDNPVVRDPLTRQPYIPGSSIKGKMRSLLERVHGLDQNWAIQRNRVHVHVCEQEEEYSKCTLCQLFGAPAPQRERWLCQTRLRFSDVFLTEASVKRLMDAATDLPFTELKSEAAIDRVTSAAVPRTMERVPAGAEFGPCDIGLFVYEGDRIATGLQWLTDGLDLLEADALGSSGARGSGRVAFTNISVRQLKVDGQRLVPRQGPATYPTVAELRRALDDLAAWAAA
ncbi:type III-A CRISPR-associated RAMP protein Csm3 [Tepidiforma thermophila]|uniref:CRISPR system Cms endoribonuclease Csm3 n=1 Tax=Tepidiforma thermophila (strain KCTC 52669 / CGMCC 1.13589 / G233) TaxID=2761530 RepID=A0A2A9HEW1_TEPT2|nr:type III-A CRISPR-associated RAMP protein Csm3 [Tepidiforma thermophila]PFG73555.1 CRISPR-associated protein Csm3 [Tepidiforma thermophila]